jgi:hypothetical protein
MGQESMRIGCITGAMGSPGTRRQMQPKRITCERAVRRRLRRGPALAD